MDLYRFINSRDVREHLEKMQYRFKPTEAAWVIYNCHRMDVTLQDKHAAWNEIIKTMPDEALPKRFNCAGFPSLHKLLTDYMAVENRLIDKFFAKENAVYFYRAFSAKDKDWYDDFGRAFPTFDAAWADAEKDFEYEITIVQVKKQSLDNPDEYMKMTFDTKRHILNVDLGGTMRLPEPDETVYLNSFMGLWFAIPHPFKAGDIVCRDESDGILDSEECRLCGGPFVLKGIIADNPPPRIVESGDESDMTAWGYFQNEDGSLYYEVMFNYIDLEYYRGELDGRKRVLTAMSNYIKEEIDSDILVRAYHYILTEEYLKSIRITDITDEGMRLAGLDN